jgi:hypothetical protein
MERTSSVKPSNKPLKTSAAAPFGSHRWFQEVEDRHDLELIADLKKRRKARQGKEPPPAKE